MRIVQHALRLKSSILKHTGGNPFEDLSPLKTLTSATLVPESAADDIVKFGEKGLKCFQEFVKNRLMSSSLASVWDPMSRLKLKTFSNFMPKTVIPLGDKMI